MLRLLHLLFLVSGCVSWKLLFLRNSPAIRNAQKEMLFAACVGLLSLGSPAFANDIETSLYKNERYHTSIQYPSKWEEKVGNLKGDRQLVAFVDPNDPDTSISVAFTPIPADFTRLTSFGLKENLQSLLLPKGDDITTNIVSEKVKGESYYLEYVVSGPRAPTRHLQNIFALRPKECIVAVVAQTKEETFRDHEQEFAASVPTLNIDFEY